MHDLLSDTPNSGLLHPIQFCKWFPWEGSYQKQISLKKKSRHRLYPLQNGSQT